jgi:hypothetical protein
MTTHDNGAYVKAEWLQPAEPFGTCDACGHAVVNGDGYVDGSDSSLRHISCVGAAYRRGLRDGYQETKRMLRAATKALNAR